MLQTMGGRDLEINRHYFEAALKFLHGASLLDPCNSNNAKHGETTQAMKVYTDTARIYEYISLFLHVSTTNLLANTISQGPKKEP